MSTKFRDHFRKQPFSAEELEELRTKIYPSLPSYKADDGSIASSDIPEALRLLKWDRSPEQLALYQEYWNSSFGGRAPSKVLVDILGNVHQIGSWARKHIKGCDKNGNGFIDKEEFELFLKIFLTDYPELTGISFEDFVKEADLNKDGKVSINEAVGWLEKKAAESK